MAGPEKEFDQELIEVLDPWKNGTSRFDAAWDDAVEAALTARAAKDALKDIPGRESTILENVESSRESARDALRVEIEAVTRAADDRKSLGKRAGRIKAALAVLRVVAVGACLWILWAAGKWALSDGPLTWPGSAGPFLLVGSLFAIEFLLPRQSDYNVSVANAEYAVSRDELEAAVRVIASDAVRTEINNQLSVPFNEFPKDATPWMSEAVNVRTEIETESARKLRSLVHQVTNGAFGVAGPRGAGKSSLLQAACAGRFTDDPNPLGLLVPAPTKWAASEFIPYLLTQLCLKLLGESVLGKRGRGTIGRRLDTLVKMSFLMYGGLAAFVVAYLVVTNDAFLKNVSPERLAIGAALIALGAFAIRTGFRAGLRPSGLLYARENEPAIQRAEDCLNALRYRSTFVDSVTGEASMSLAKLGFKSERSMTEVGFSDLEITNQLLDLISEIAAEREVILGIDELDKMGSIDDVVALLNEVKVMFGQRNCTVLVSVSDDALSAFERRGLPVRDAFDSAFSEVLRVELLSLRESRELLLARIVGLSDAFVSFIHVVAGGLPREILRTARLCVEVAEHGSTSLSACAEAVARARITGVEHAIESASQSSVASDGRQPTIAWLSTLPEIGTASDLIHRWDISEVWEAVGTRYPGSVGREQQASLAELAATSYHLHTCVLFAQSINPETASKLMTTLNPTVEALARARHRLSLAPEIAWSLTSEIRNSMGFDEFEYPIEQTAFQIASPIAKI
jgi:hypothetical protein